MADLSATAAAVVKRARAFDGQTVLNCDAATNDELFGHQLITRAWVMDWSGGPAWPLTDKGLALRERLLDSPERRARLAWAARVSQQIIADLTGSAPR